MDLVLIRSGFDLAMLFVRVDVRSQAKRAPVQDVLSMMIMTVATVIYILTLEETRKVVFCRG